jgi:uncharacterized protein YbjT (DUF2867 family)
MTILVTGATGNIGRRVVDHLIDLGANDIRALTTNPAKANLPDSVTPVTGYLGKPESLRAAFDGVDRMYLAPLPQTLGATLELAKAADVEYLVALSGVGYWQTHADAISASDQIRTSATVRDPYPNAVEAVISMDDIARVAATLLVKPEQRHHGRMYAITGPEALPARRSPNRSASASASASRWSDAAATRPWRCYGRHLATRQAGTSTRSPARWTHRSRPIGSSRN